MAELSFDARMEPPVDELVARFKGAGRILNQQQAQRMNVLGNRLLGLIRDGAPHATGKYASRITLTTHRSGDSYNVEIRAPEPLTTWLTRGTRAHEIRPKGPGYPLRFYWAKGPKGPGVYHFMRVWHPGTRGKPFIASAYRQWKPEAEAEMRSLVKSYVRSLSGAGAGQFGY